MDICSLCLVLPLYRLTNLSLYEVVRSFVVIAIADVGGEKALESLSSTVVIVGLTGLFLANCLPSLGRPAFTCS